MLIISILKGVWPFDINLWFVLIFNFIHLICYACANCWSKILIRRYLDLSWSMLNLYFLLFLLVSFNCFRILLKFFIFLKLLWFFLYFFYWVVFIHKTILNLMKSTFTNQRWCSHFWMYWSIKIIELLTVLFQKFKSSRSLLHVVICTLLDIYFQILFIIVLCFTCEGILKNVFLQEKTVFY